MQELDQVRQEITHIDQEIARLLSRRFEAVVKVGKIKAQKQLAVLDRGRQEQVLENVRAHSQAEYAPYISDIYQEIMKQARKYQSQARK